MSICGKKKHFRSKKFDNAVHSVQFFLLLFQIVSNENLETNKSVKNLIFFEVSQQTVSKLSKSTTYNYPVFSLQSIWTSNNQIFTHTLNKICLELLNLWPLNNYRISFSFKPVSIEQQTVFLAVFNISFLMAK